jgi:hypothetical protein
VYAFGATITFAQSGSATASPRVDAARLESLTIKDAEAQFVEKNRELGAARRAVVERNAGFMAGGFDYRDEHEFPQFLLIYVGPLSGIVA